MVMGKPIMPGLGRIFSSLKLVVYVLLIASIYALYRIYSNDTDWYYRPAPCQYPEDVRKDLIDLTKTVHNLLDSKNIQHFLCYGTLWGAMRYQEILHWDNDIEFCVYNEDLDITNQAYFNRMFNWHNITIKYDARYGLYKMYYRKAYGEMILFHLSNDYKWLLRHGWDRSLKNEKPRSRFPSELAAPPLPTLKFHNMKMPVPRRDIEIQKYFYPKDWWKEIKPPGC